MKFRPQRDGFTESMQEVQEFNTRLEFIDYLFRKWRYSGYPKIEEFYDSIEIRPYGNGIDERNGWNTHIVTLNGKGIGFTDGPLPTK